MPALMSEAERNAPLNAWADALHGITDRPLLYFHPSNDYDDRQRLRPEVEPGSGFQHHP